MTREKAIKMLECIATDTTGALAGESGKHAEFLVRVIDSLDMAIAALEEQENAKTAHCNCCKKGNSSWISVADRLPTAEDANPNESVLAILKEDGFAKSWWYDIVVRHPKEFTHWMPLPEPPEVDT